MTTTVARTTDTDITDSRTTAKRTTETSVALTPEQIADIGRELDQIRADIMGSRGAADAAYIRRVIKTQRLLELTSRAVLLFSIFPPAWLVGTAGLSIAKIMENMEIGHNVLHGQWDWMRDPKIHSTTWEWDFVSPAAQWKHTHNELHHTYTNVIGRDNDLGYGIMRVDEKQPWTLYSLVQAPVNLLNAIFFEYGIALYDMETLEYQQGHVEKEVFVEKAKATLRKVGRQVGKDFVLHPLLSGPSFLHTMAANATANLVRNVWTHSVIICGHFPDGVEAFETDSIEGETKDEWYLRQMLGSANISGSKFFHLMTGNLSHQIEHHLFPDMPSNRYHEAAPRVRALFEKHGLRYVIGPMHRQLGSAWWKIMRLSLPNQEEGRTRGRIIADAAKGAIGRGVRGLARKIPQPAIGV
ncbi:fatty acid desaturase family protein [Mariniluteicoccus flavus]